MSWLAVKGTLTFSSQVRRDGVRSSALEQIDVLDLDEDLYVDEAGRFAWTFVARVALTSEQEAIRDRLLAAPNVETRFGHLHICGHDTDPPVPCVVTETF